MASRKIVATIEARMTSNRLPGKVLMKSLGKPLLEHLVERLAKVKQLDAIVIATTTNATDDGVEALALRLADKYPVTCHRGSEEDVLRRVLEAADSVKGQIIVEITGDCPLLDPDIVTQTLELYLKNTCDYVANCTQLTFPAGMEVQVFSTELLRRADIEGLLPEDREHVSWYFLRNPQLFKLLNLSAPQNLHHPDFRLTLDEIDDYKLIDRVLTELYPRNPNFTCSDMVQLLLANPEWLAINQHVQQKTVEGTP